jgi:hypothetical protein
VASFYNNHFKFFRLNTISKRRKKIRKVWSNSWYRGSRSFYIRFYITNRNSNSRPY